MNLHLVKYIEHPVSPYNKAYYDFIRASFLKYQNIFFTLGDVPKNNDQYLIAPRYRIKVLKYIHLMLLMLKADRIFLHDLTVINFLTKKLWWLLSYLPCNFTNKFYWIIWGGDLYSTIEKQSSNIENRYDILIKAFVKKIGHIITPIKGDYELSKEYFNHDAEYHFAYYPSFINSESKSIFQQQSEKKLLLGNSADPSNNHRKMINILNKNDYKGNIICPLSYGDMSYAENIAEYGSLIFGDRFIPLLKPIQYKEYSELMDSISVAVFAHNRQQALGNIFRLIAKGKKIYINSRITTWTFLKDNGIAIHDIKELDIRINCDEIFYEENSVLIRNAEIINKIFNKKQLWNNWVPLLEY